MRTKHIFGKLSIYNFTFFKLGYFLKTTFSKSFCNFKIFEKLKEDVNYLQKEFFIESLLKVLTEKKIIAKIIGREKTPFSIWRKIIIFLPTVIPIDFD